MRLGDVNAAMIGQSITIRDRENESPEWVVRGRLVSVEHLIHYDPPNTSTKVSIRVGPGGETVTELMLPSDYEF